MPLGAAKVALLGAAGSGEDALGYMLFWGDPDGTEGGQETYPYSLELLNDGTTVRVGGRWNLNPGGNATQRIAHSNLDMSGGAGVAPTTSTVQTAWSFSITSSTQEGIYQEQSGQGLAISAADNFYSTGNVYGAGSANYWYNLGVIKMNSAGATQWDVVWRDNHYASNGLSLAAIWYNESNSIPGASAVFTESVATGVKNRHALWSMSDSDGSITFQRKLYMGNDTVDTGNTMGSRIIRSNVVGTDVVTVHDYYNETDAYKNTFTPMRWNHGSSYITNRYALANTGIRNISTGGPGITPTGCWQDSSNNSYTAFYFAATAIASGYTPSNIGICKYNSSGTLQWVYVLRQQAGGVEHSMYSGGIDGDNSNNIYVSGYSTEIGGSNSAAFIAKLDVSHATVPTLTWITQVEHAGGHAYSQNCKLVGSDAVVSMGYGTTDNDSGGTAVVGAVVSLNIDGTTLGTGTVDGQAIVARDLSPYIVFATGASGGTTNVEIINQTSNELAQSVDTNLVAGYEDTWVNDVPPAEDIVVESGGIT